MEFVVILSEIFPNHSRQTINRIITYVDNDGGLDDPDDFRLERMTSLLLDEAEDLFDEAIGYQGNSELAELLRKLLIRFPDACPVYIERMLESEDLEFDMWVENLETNGYTKKQTSLGLDDIYSKLMEMLPQVDPGFLKTKAEELIGQTEEDLICSMNEMLDSEDCPSIDEFNKREVTKKEIQRYTSNFTVDDFLREIPDPFKFFLNSNRDHSLLRKNQPDGTFNSQFRYAHTFLYNKYDQLYKNDVDMYMKYFDNDVVKACQRLDKFPKALKTKRAQLLQPQCSFNNKLLLQELAFVQYSHVLKQYLKLKDEAYKQSYEEAKRENLLETCQTCFLEELIPEECYFCRGNCVFCRECMKKGAEVIIGNGNLDFPCFNNCGKDISIKTLQIVLDPIVFSRLEKRKQMDDIKKANLECFMTCQFCDYGNLQNPQDKIFVCKNEDCGKETCLECGHESHIPKRCSEIEYPEDVVYRTFIENKMTEALLRTCQSCGKKIVKEGGCNKMTCTCGITMCYICGTSRIGYNHFDDGICTLQTDQNELHINNVMDGARNAKKELGIDLNPSKLKFDPSVDVQNHIP